MKSLSRWVFLFVLISLLLMSAMGCGQSSSDSETDANTFPAEEISPIASMEGYNLFAPLNETTAYLMDRDGNLVHTWATGHRPGNAVYLLENGELLHTGNLGSTTFEAGGAGGIVQTLDWEGHVTWTYEYAETTHLQHHDVEGLPDGNVLLVAWQLKTGAEAVAAGRDPSLLADGELWPDSVIEVKPTGPDTGEIVWQWNVWDHLVQDLDAAKPDYGVVADHPGRIDLNFVLDNGGADWNHINAVDYNAELDQIVLTVHHFSEIWVIDHSTTTAEAAGATGGNSGKGGDLLYRWGNPRAYGRGGAADQQLFGPHDAGWIDGGAPGAGNLLIFNNGGGRPGGNYSSVDEIVPPVEEDGSYSLTADAAYGPDLPTWTYTAGIPADFYAPNISGAQRLSNGNTLICNGPGAVFFEVTADGETVWTYAAAGEVFRVERYAPSYAGFERTPLDENDPDQDSTSGLGYPIVDTSQTTFYDDTRTIQTPARGEPFYGQDAHFTGHQPSYTPSGDGLTVTDNVTGLTWTQSPDLDGDGDIDAADKLTFAEAQAFPATLNAETFGGYNDWRLPTIKELYSLMNFNGTDPIVQGSDTTGLTPFIDTGYFAFGYGDTAAGERIIDAQFWSDTIYVDAVFGSQTAAFGLNLADGRIKGYPTAAGPTVKTCYVYFVRGNSGYGVNRFIDNGDGTVTDEATGRMWSREDSGTGMNWENALAWVQQQNTAAYLGHSDWRLPNAKELQSLLDYTRSPGTTATAAIDPVFSVTAITNEVGEADFPWFWTGTTHRRFDGSGSAGVYLCFGRAMGYMNGSWLDVHGAGAQRSDPKGGDFSGYTYEPDGYCFAMSPQGDAVRIDNFVRLVRDADNP